MSFLVKLLLIAVVVVGFVLIVRGMRARANAGRPSGPRPVDAPRRPRGPLDE